MCSASAEEPPKPPAEKFTIVVTGAYAPTPAQDLNRNVEVTNIREQRPLLRSFADVLQSNSSIDLRQRGPNDIQGDLSIRGGSFSQSLVLLNGLRLNDTQSGHHNLDLPLAVDAMSEVQVLRGSGSTQYGSDAVTGVVNILTRPPDPEMWLRTGVGNFGTNQQSGSVSARLRSISQQLVFSRDFSTGFIPNRDYRYLALTSVTRATSRLGETGVVLSLSDRPFGAEQYYGNFNSWERTKGWFASVRQELGSKTGVDFAYRRHTDLFVLYRDRPQVFTNRHAVESWQADIRRKEDFRSAGRLFYGAEMYADSIVSNNLGSHFRVREAAYVAWEQQWRKRISFSAGLRDQVYSAFRHDWSPSLSAGFWISDRWKLRVAASRAFRLPTYTDLYYHDPANVGSPDLRPESAWSYEAGIDFRPAPRVRAELTVFQRRDRDLIDYVRDSPTAIFRATNFQQLTFTGVEAALNVRAGSAQFFNAQYTALNGDRALLPGSISKYVFNYPSHKGTVSWTGAIGQLAARTRIGVLNRLDRDPYAIWDLSLARSRGRLRPFAQFTNLTSTVYQEIPGVAMPERGIVAGVELRVFELR